MTYGSVLPWVRSWRVNRRQELTREDEQVFGKIKIEDFRNRVSGRLPGEAPIIEGINPESKTVIYVGSNGRRVIPLEELGYKVN